MNHKLPNDLDALGQCGMEQPDHYDSEVEGAVPPCPECHNTGRINGDNQTHPCPACAESNFDRDLRASVLRVYLRDALIARADEFAVLLARDVAENMREVGRA